MNVAQVLVGTVRIEKSAGRRAFSLEDEDGHRTPLVLARANQASIAAALISLNGEFCEVSGLMSREAFVVHSVVAVR